jgi:pre-mRNA-processing factor 6
VQNIPKSKKLWILASEKEQDVLLKQKVLRKALEHLPGEEDLWKMLVELEQPE